MGPMGELGALFNPGMRHELEERRSKAARREEEGNARDGDLRIDLESGVAVIGIPGTDDRGAPDDDGSAAGAQAAAQSDGSAPAPDDESTSVSTTPEDPSSSSASPGVTAAEEKVEAQDKTAPAPVLRPRGKRGLSATRR